MNFQLGTSVIAMNAPSMTQSVQTPSPREGAVPISVSTASHPDPPAGAGTVSSAMLGMKRPRTAAAGHGDDARDDTGKGAEQMQQQKQQRRGSKAPRLASVPSVKISKRPSLGGFTPFAALNHTPPGRAVPRGADSSTSSTPDDAPQEKTTQQPKPAYLTSSYSAASAASTQAHAADGDRRRHLMQSASVGFLPRSMSTQSLPGFEVSSSSSATAPSCGKKDENDDSTCSNAGSVAAELAKSAASVPSVAALARATAASAASGGQSGAVTKASPAMRKSLSLVSVMSPQLCLDTILKTRGYCTQNYCSLEGGYYCKPTPHQQASYGIRLVQATRTSDVNLLKSLLRCGLSRNPCNSFGESIVHMVCRRGDDNLLQVLIDLGCSLQVSDDFGRTPLHDACWTATPNFRLVDLILRTDIRLLRIVDCRGASPLSYVKKENWESWVGYFESRKDEFWPGRDVAKEGEEGPPSLVGAKPHSRPVVDPDDAAPIELVKMVASGQIGPDEAMKKKEEMKKDDAMNASSHGGIKASAAPIAAA